MTQQDQTNRTAPQNGRAAIYARLAEGPRMQTGQQQTNTLIELANAQGFPNERIIVGEDTGASAREPLVTRDALSDLLKALMLPVRAQEPIWTIFVSSARKVMRRTAGTRRANRKRRH